MFVFILKVSVFLDCVHSKTKRYGKSKCTHGKERQLVIGTMRIDAIELWPVNIHASHN